MADDGYGWPLCHRIGCARCPRPTEPSYLVEMIDSVRDYDPDMDDKRFGFSDYDVPLAHWYRGPQDVMGLCFSCLQECNLSRGYGHEAVPESLCQRHNHAVAYCQQCYRAMRQRHEEPFTFSAEPEQYEQQRRALVLRLTLYWDKTYDGCLLTKVLQ